LPLGDVNGEALLAAAAAEPRSVRPRSVATSVCIFTQLASRALDDHLRRGAVADDVSFL